MTEATLQSSPLAANVRILFQQGLQIPCILKHLQHLPLQLDNRLLQHLVADHKWDLVSQMLAGNLKEEKEVEQTKSGTDDHTLSAVIIFVHDKLNLL